MADKFKYQSSLLDFQRARRRANLEQILARLTGRSAELLSYDDVREKLRARGGSSRGLRDIPLDAIVGSVGRYTDFSRSFLPRDSVSAKRWAGVGMAVAGNMGLPPIDAYKIGDVYFVLDGNHRVSIARELGATHIEAYVTEVYTRVPLSPGDRPDDLILKARYAEFLERTKLDELRPGADLSTTAPGQYRKLDEHIEVHQYFMGIDYERTISDPEAVTHWYDEVYMPVVESIRQQNILREFPNRTETDLYIWVMEHRQDLAHELGWHVEPEDAVADLVAKVSSSPVRILTRVRDRFLHAVALDSAEPVAPANSGRRSYWEANPNARFAKDILVPVSGYHDGWAVLDAAIILAKADDGRLHGLHVVPTHESMGESALSVKEFFEERCRQAGVSGTLKIEVGSINQLIMERARWVDLVAVQLFHPPGATAKERLSSGFRSLLLRCPAPVLVVPACEPAMSHILLAFDGSPKALEALYIATYMVTHHEMALSVLTVNERGGGENPSLADAERYLAEHDVTASFHTVDYGDAGKAIVEAADELGTDLIAMGGYGYGNFWQAVLGSSVDYVLRETKQPVLICR